MPYKPLKQNTMIRTLNGEPKTPAHNPYWFNNVCGGEISSGQMIYWLTSDADAVMIAKQHNEWAEKQEQVMGRKLPHLKVFYINSKKLSDYEV